MRTAEEELEAALWSDSRAASGGFLKAWKLLGKPERYVSPVILKGLILRHDPVAKVLIVETQELMIEVIPLEKRPFN